MKTTLAALAAFFMLTAAALAQEPNTVSFPVGDWIVALAEPLQAILASLLLAAATALAAMLPSWIQDIVRPLVLTWRTNQLFEKAAATAVAGVKGSAAGKQVTIGVANDLVRTMLQIAVSRGAPVVLEFAGRSATALAEKALARLQEQDVRLPEDYTITDAAAQARTVLQTQGGA